MEITNEKIKRLIFSSLVKFSLRSSFCLRLKKSVRIFYCSNFINNKKGMFFTLMTIAFLSIFIFIFMIPSYTRLGEKMTVVEMRVDSMNDFIKDLERDAERGLYISSYRALLALEEYIATNGTFLQNAEKSFIEAIFNGTVNNKTSYFMVDSTFPLWIAKIKEEAAKFSIEINIAIGNITLYQNNPWSVNAAVNLTLSVKDTTNLASWERKEYVETSISIIEFEDPLYIVNSFGRMTNRINKTHFEGNYTYKIGEQWNVSNLLAHAENSYYTSNPLAPSFLMRLENDIAPSPYGIESLVNLLKVSRQGLELNTQSSIVDYYYWDEANNGDYRINFTPSWFKLDQAHLARYNVTQISCEVGSEGCNI